MSWSEAEIPIEDSRYFKTLNGLWTGKKPPFKHAGVIRNTNFTSAGKIDYSKIAYLEVEENQLSSRKLEPGDIIIERSGGGPKQPVGRVVFFDQIEGEFSFSNFTSAIRVSDKQAFEPKFVFYRLLELYQSGRTEDIQRRTTGIRNLDFTAYKQRARIPRIPLEEQREIVRILSTVQRAIEAQERIIQTTTELKQALMQKLFSEGLRGEPQKETEIGLVPESWEVVECGDICETISVGIVVQPSSYYVKEGVPAFRSQNVRADRIQVEPMVYISKEANDGPVRKSKLSAGDVLIVRTGYPGTSCVVPPEFEGSNCIDLIFARPDKLRLSSHYLSRFFNSDLAKRQVQAGKTGLAQQHYNVAAVKSTKIPLPSLGEQERIVSNLELVDSKIETAASRFNALQELFYTLLRELMTAKMRTCNLRLSAAQLSC